jgi:hypothetical protein
VNTYAWMIATIVSKVSRANCIISVIVFIFTLIKVCDKVDNKVKIKCPAIILAARRTESVIGRIISLISSTSTIKGVIRRGVPIGTK